MTVRHTGIVLTAVLVAGLLAVWLVFLLNAQADYDPARGRLDADLGEPFAVRLIDEDLRKTIGVIESTWQRQGKGVPSPHAAALRLAGIAPSVDGLIELYYYRMPDFSWLNSSRNRESREIAFVQAKIVPISLDKTIHVSADRRIALVRVTEAVVFIFREDPNGLSETVWARPTGSVEEDSATQGEKPGR